MGNDRRGAYLSQLDSAIERCSGASNGSLEFAKSVAADECEPEFMDRPSSVVRRKGRRRMGWFLFAKRFSRCALCGGMISLTKIELWRRFNRVTGSGKVPLCHGNRLECSRTLPTNLLLTLGVGV